MFICRAVVAAGLTSMMYRRFEKTHSVPAAAIGVVRCVACQARPARSGAQRALCQCVGVAMGPSWVTMGCEGRVMEGARRPLGWRGRVAVFVCCASHTQLGVRAGGLGLVARHTVSGPGHPAPCPGALTLFQPMHSWGLRARAARLEYTGRWLEPCHVLSQGTRHMASGSQLVIYVFAYAACVILLLLPCSGGMALFYAWSISPLGPKPAAHGKAH